MDEETRKLIAAMCARAGMIMEDVSVTAVLTVGFEPPEAIRTLAYLADATQTVSALIEAASRLHCFASEGRHTIIE